MQSRRHKKAMNQQLGPFSLLSGFCYRLLTGPTWMNCKRACRFQRLRHLATGLSSGLCGALTTWATWMGEAQVCSILQSAAAKQSLWSKGQRCAMDVPWMCRLLIPSPTATHFKLLLACLSAGALRWCFLLFLCNKLVFKLL